MFSQLFSSSPKPPFRVGDNVVLWKQYDGVRGATEGPLKPGEIGKIVAVEKHRERAYQVRTPTNAIWNYPEGALLLADTPPEKVRGRIRVGETVRVVDVNVGPGAGPFKLGDTCVIVLDDLSLWSPFKALTEDGKPWWFAEKAVARARDPVPQTATATTSRKPKTVEKPKAPPQKQVTKGGSETEGCSASSTTMASSVPEGKLVADHWFGVLIPPPSLAPKQNAVPATCEPSAPVVSAEEYELMNSARGVPSKSVDVGECELPKGSVCSGPSESAPVISAEEYELLSSARGVLSESAPSALSKSVPASQPQQILPNTSSNITSRTSPNITSSTSPNITSSTSPNITSSTSPNTVSSTISNTTSNTTSTQPAAAQPPPSDNTKECIICCDKNADAVFYKCGHFCCCFGCATNLKNSTKECPMCRQKIVDVMRLFPC